eukprot:5263690-Amphidinium_carterae.1
MPAASLNIWPHIATTLCGKLRTVKSLRTRQSGLCVRGAKKRVAESEGEDADVEATPVCSFLKVCPFVAQRAMCSACRVNRSNRLGASSESREVCFPPSTFSTAGSMFDGAGAAHCIGLFSARSYNQNMGCASWELNRHFLFWKLCRSEDAGMKVPLLRDTDTPTSEFSVPGLCV